MSPEAWVKRVGNELPAGLFYDVDPLPLRVFPLGRGKVIKKLKIKRKR